MSESDKRRSIVLQRVAMHALTLEQATHILSLSYRHMKRVWKRFRDEGPEGLVHKSRGRPSNRAFQHEFREDVLRRYAEEPPGTGPTRFASILAAQGIFVDHETLRRWLLESGVWTLSRNRAGQRQPEPSARAFGELLTLVSLQDGWLGSGRPASFLFLLLDEATSQTLCSVVMEESCEAAMRLLAGWIERHGLPAALRCQRRFLLEENKHPTLEQQLCGAASTSSLARACDRLGVDVAQLSPPQTKAWLGCRRDVLAALKRQLNRRSAASEEEATRLLRGAAGDSLNRRFAACADGLPDYHVPIVDGTDLRRILCVDQLTRVGPEGTVSFGRRQFRLLGGQGSVRALPTSVVVSHWLDGSFHILHDGMELPFLETSSADLRPRLAI